MAFAQVFQVDSSIVVEMQDRSTNPKRQRLGQLRPLPKDYIAGNFRNVVSPVQRLQSLQDLAAYLPHAAAKLQSRLEDLNLDSGVSRGRGVLQ